MVEQISLSPQVKRNLTISNKLVYTSCLTSCRTKILIELIKLIELIELFIELLPRAQSSSENETFVCTS